MTAFRDPAHYQMEKYQSIIRMDPLRGYLLLQSTYCRLLKMACRSYRLHNQISPVPHQFVYFSARFQSDDHNPFVKQQYQYHHPTE